jgi:hypothetical protein
MSPSSAGSGTLADRKDERFFVERGFTGPRRSTSASLRLGAVIIWCEGAVGAGRASLWVNASVRIALPDRAAVACLACFRA